MQSRLLLLLGWCEAAQPADPDRECAASSCIAPQLNAMQSVTVLALPQPCKVYRSGTQLRPLSASHAILHPARPSRSVWHKLTASKVPLHPSARVAAQGSHLASCSYSRGRPKAHRPSQFHGFTPLSREEGCIPSSTQSCSVEHLSCCQQHWYPQQQHNDNDHVRTWVMRVMPKTPNPTAPLPLRNTAQHAAASHHLPSPSQSAITITTPSQSSLMLVESTVQPDLPGAPSHHSTTTTTPPLASPAAVKVAVTPVSKARQYVLPLGPCHNLAA